MSADFVIDVAERGIYTILIVSGPLLLIALGVGLAISIFQATTQIQEQTLAFVPKIVAVFLAILIFGGWMLQHVLDFTQNLLGNLSQFVG